MPRATYLLPRHFLLLSELFAAWALGISSQQNLRRRRPSSAPQVLHPPKTCCPWIVATLRRLQHSGKTSCIVWDSESVDSWGDPIPPMKVFHDGRLSFHKSYRPPYLSATLMPSCTRAVVTTGLRPARREI